MLVDGHGAEARDEIDTQLNARLPGEPQAESAQDFEERRAAEMAAFAAQAAVRG